jgi:hypothetical protein
MWRIVANTYFCLVRYLRRKIVVILQKQATRRKKEERKLRQRRNAGMKISQVRCELPAPRLALCEESKKAAMEDNRSPLLYFDWISCLCFATFT